MSAYAVDLIVYGIPIAIIGVLGYYGGKPPKPPDQKPEPEKDSDDN
jgi:hypothetical protein